MKKKVKVCKFDARTKKYEILEEEMDFPDVEIKMYNPIEQLRKDIDNLTKQLLIKTINKSFGDNNFSKITSDNIYKLKFPSSTTGTISQLIPAGLIHIDLRARVFGGHDNNHVKEPQLKIYINNTLIFQASQNAVEGDFLFNKIMLSNGGILKIEAGNTGKYVYFPSSASFVAPYSSPSSPWLIYVEYTIKVLTI